MSIIEVQHVLNITFQDMFFKILPFVVQKIILHTNSPLAIPPAKCSDGDSPSPDMAQSALISCQQSMTKAASLEYLRGEKGCIFPGSCQI